MTLAKLKFRPRLGIATVLVVGITVLIAVLMAITTWLEVRRQHDIFIGELEVRAVFIADAVQSAMAAPLAGQDFSAMANITEIVVDLPDLRKMDVYSPDGQVTPSSVSRPTGQNRSRNMTTERASRRVLIIDDDEWIQKVVSVSLEAVAGWDIRVAGSGPEGIEMAVENVPEAILLDVMMPGMDGPETLAKIREEDAIADVPVVLLTAKALPEDRRDLSELPVAGMIGKPFDPMTLANQVEVILGWVA